MNPPAASNRRKAFFGILLAGTNLLCLGGGIVFGRITGGGGKTEVDLSVVRDSVTAAAFYELVFDPDAPATMHKALVPDPITKVRARPLHPGNGQAGPHDALGFRSEGVANDLEIVTIGDSQTYGWNVAIADTWPSRLAELSGKPVYNMALGGWGGAQYRYIAEKALRFKPERLVVGLYMGNDAIESLTQVYAAAEFSSYRIPGHPDLKGFDLKFEREDPEAVRLPDRTIEFTPTRRLFVNDRKNPAVTAGYELLARLAEDLARLAKASGAETTFVVIPTKESVYAPLLARHGITASPGFTRLVADEAANAAELIARLEGAQLQVVDTTKPLQDAVLAGVAAYPDHADGHPSAPGYRVVAQAVYDRIHGAEQGRKNR